MEELIEKLREFAKERDWDQFHSPKNLSIALVVEASEILEHFQWMSDDKSRMLTKDKLQQVREEIGDTMIYLLMLADKLHIDVIDAATSKMAVNATKYPIEKSKGKSAKYTELK